MATSAKAGSKAAAKKPAAKATPKATPAPTKAAPLGSVESLRDLEQQIQALQSQANEIRANERKGAIAQAKELVRQFGLTARELGLAADMKVGPKSAPAAARFADGQGNSWSGMGKRPKWLHDALAQGKTLDELRVSA